jgi:hypothetical protein
MMLHGASVRRGSLHVACKKETLGYGDQHKDIAVGLVDVNLCEVAVKNMQAAGR